MRLFLCFLLPLGFAYTGNAQRVITLPHVEFSASLATERPTFYDAESGASLTASRQFYFDFTCSLELRRRLAVYTTVQLHPQSERSQATLPSQSHFGIGLQHHFIRFCKWRASVMVDAGLTEGVFKDVGERPLYLQMRLEGSQRMGPGHLIVRAGRTFTGSNLGAGKLSLFRKFSVGYAVRF